MAGGHEVKKAPGADLRAGNTKTAFLVGDCNTILVTLNHCEGLKKEMPLRSNVRRIYMTDIWKNQLFFRDNLNILK